MNWHQGIPIYYKRLRGRIGTNEFKFYRGLKERVGTWEFIYVLKSKLNHRVQSFLTIILLTVFNTGKFMCSEISQSIKCHHIGNTCNESFTSSVLCLHGTFIKASFILSPYLVRQTGTLSSSCPLPLLYIL